MPNQTTPLLLLLLIVALTYNTVLGVEIEYALEFPTLKTIHISNARAGIRYMCSECKESLIPRQGTVNQHHFAHQNHGKMCLAQPT